MVYTSKVKNVGRETKKQTLSRKNSKFSFNLINGLRSSASNLIQVIEMNDQSSRAINANRKFNQFIDRKVNSIEQIATTL